MNKALATTVGAATLLALFSVSASAALDDAKAEALMKNSGCAACHKVDMKLVGPAYKEVAAKRKGDADALATMEKSVRNGSKGVYGPMPMPPNPAAKISDADLHDLLVWVLSK